MISQKIVSPSKIESELLKIWESLSKENTNRAGLFTLIVFSKRSPRLNHIRDTVQNIIEKFPCRIIFITYDQEAKKSYLKTAVTVLFPPSKGKEVACDSIDIGVGKEDLKKVKYVILPLLLPDLPAHLFWCENPEKENTLLFELKELTSKIIFDSETADSLFTFSKFIIQNFSDKKKDIVDLNWLKTDDMRDIIATEFSNYAKTEILSDINSVDISVNQIDSLHTSKFLIQTYYIIFWFSSRLNWLFIEKQPEDNPNSIFFKNDNVPVKINIKIENNKNFSNGDILKINLKTKENVEVIFKHLVEDSSMIKVESISPDQCGLPHDFRLLKFEIGHFLANEMITKSTDNHFIETLLKISEVLND